MMNTNKVIVMKSRCVGKSFNLLVVMLDALQDAERCLTRTAQDERDINTLKKIRQVITTTQKGA